MKLSANAQTYSFFGISICFLVLAFAFAVERSPAGCRAEKVMAHGYGHNFKSMAEFKAITSWSEEAQLIGKDYASWHNARKRRVFCKTLPNKRYYRCLARAVPCKATNANNTHSNIPPKAELFISPLMNMSRLYG